MFKALCAERGTTMTAEIQRLMREELEKAGKPATDNAKKDDTPTHIRKNGPHGSEHRRKST